MIGTNLAYLPAGTFGKGCHMSDGSTKGSMEYRALGFFIRVFTFVLLTILFAGSSVPHPPIKG
jgi:hypothetical protein